MDMEGEFPSLQDHCLHHLVTHLADHPPSTSLVLLPRHLRLLLLQNVAPLHLVWLERTVIAEGQDTSALWEKFRDCALHKEWIVNQPTPTVPSSETIPMRDLYIAFIYYKLFSTTHPFPAGYLLSRRNSKCLPVAVYLYGLSEPMVGKGILQVARNSPLTLTGQIESQVVCVPDYSIEMNAFESVCAELLKYNAFSRVLYLPLSSCDNLLAIGSSARRRKQLEQLFTFSDVTEQLSVTLSDKLADDVTTTVKVLSGLGRSMMSRLSSLQLASVSEKTLSLITPLLSSPRFRIKSLEFTLFQAKGSHVPLLVEILRYQTSLEVLYLTFNKTTCGDHGHLLLSSLCQLFTYPNFWKLKLQNMIDFPVAGLVSAFLCSSLSHDVTLELVKQRISDATVVDGSTIADLKLPTSDHAQQYGQKRYLIFDKLTASRTFYEWLFSMPCLNLNVLVIRFSKMIADGGELLNLEEKLATHSNASVTTFNGQYFNLVPW